MDGVGEDTQAYMDQSILAIFDAPVPSEGRGGVEEDSEKLLSALTEMLDSVGDDDLTLSPFDTLPDTKLLVHPEHRNISEKPLVASRLRLNQTKEIFPVEEKNKVENSTKKKNFPVSLNARTKKIDSELEVFTTASLVNLVKLMHPYCLRLHVNDEGAKWRSNHACFSQEEVWRYERPTEGSDEEINVVSDDEVKEIPERRTDSKLLKSALLKRKSSRERKRVSFGPVEVASFDEALTSGGETTTEEVCDSPQVSASEAGTTRSPTKTKALSLQQYRQLRQQRQPLVAKQRNYTTRWPSVPEAPQELTPILSSQGHKLQTSDAASARPLPSEAGPYTPAKCGKLKRPRTEPKAPPSPAQPLAGAAADAPLAPQGKVSPVKRAAAVRISSDPPNPVLLTVPLSQASPKEQTSWRSSEEPSPAERLSGASVDQPPAIEEAAASTQDAKSSGTVVAPPCSTATHFNSEAEALQAEIPMEQRLPSPVVSGIEAADLTSLLEQFEETQAKETGPEPSDGGTPGTPLPPLLTPEAAPVPEPLGREVILGTQQDPKPARRKQFLSKSIQIIDPRPLPTRKTLLHPSEASNALTSPHLYASVSSDHDYCAPAHRSPTSTESSTVAGSLLNANNSACKQSNSPDEVDASDRESEETAAPVDPPPPTVHSVDTQRTCKSAAYHQVAPCVVPSPPARGRRYRRRSPSSDSSSSSYSSSSSASSSSCSPSPKRQRRRHKHSESSSSSSSSPSRSVSQSPPQSYRWSCSRNRCSRSRSRSRSWSSSRSRSPPANIHRNKWRDVYNSRKSRRMRREHELRIQKLKAIDERRVVYVGRICRSMTHDELRERFSQFGEVECVSLHFRERGDHYAFVTFYDMNDAFAAIDNGSKLRRPDELPFDLCFGGRRQFCNSDYADLDANKDSDLAPARSRCEDLDFDQLLKQAQKGMKR